MEVPDADPAPSLSRTVGQAILLGVAYAAAVRMATAISIPNVTIAPIRLPNAFAITALLLTPPSTWWVYLLAIVPMHLGLPNASAGAIYFVANSVESLIAADALRRVMHGRPRLDGLRACITFVIVAVIVAPMISGFIGAIAVQRIYPAVAFAHAWRLWSFGDAVGNVAVVPALLALEGLRRRVRDGIRPPRAAEAAALLVAIVAGSLPTLGIFGAEGRIERHRVLDAVHSVSPAGLGGAALRRAGSSRRHVAARDAVGAERAPGSRAVRTTGERGRRAPAAAVHRRRRGDGGDAGGRRRRTAAHAGRSAGFRAPLPQPVRHGERRHRHHRLQRAPRDGQRGVRDDHRLDARRLVRQAYDGLSGSEGGRRRPRATEGHADRCRIAAGRSGGCGPGRETGAWPRSRPPCSPRADSRPACC